MAPPNPPDLPPPTPKTVSDGARGSFEVSGSRYSWTVKDCLIASWYELSDAYSIDEMWRFLRQGRFSHARRVE
jgi:hypothetical protein